MPPIRYQPQGDDGAKPYSFQIGEREFIIYEIIDQWYGTNRHFYKVRADDGNIYILKHSSMTDIWELEYFKREDLTRQH
ncbi:MAG: hypothetical protein ABII23_03910 [bacterium]